MRLFPPAHTIARQPIAADEVLGQRIPAGAEVLIVPWLLHRRLRSGSIPTASIRSALRPSAPPRDRASPIFHSAAARASASAPLSL